MARASRSEHKHTLAVYVPVASATEEKSLNRLPPFVFFWCSISSMRWAGITICFFIMSAKARVAPEGSLHGDQLCWHAFSTHQAAAGLAKELGAEEGGGKGGGGTDKVAATSALQPLAAQPACSMMLPDMWWPVQAQQRRCAQSWR